MKPATSTHRDTAAQTPAAAPGSPETPASPAAGAVETACATSIAETAFGCRRDFLNNRFVYVVISPRARGLAAGINFNPDKRCNFNCVYCEVDRTIPPRETRLDVEVAAAELLRTLALVHSGELKNRPEYQALPADLLSLRHVSLSGDGEPTLCPNFAEALQAFVHVRALGRFPFFKLVLITNATGLHLPNVQQSMKFLTKQDEIWAKLEVGTEAHFETLNKPDPGITLEKVMENILLVGRQRRIVIQSLFPVLAGREPQPLEIEDYVARLNELKAAGAQIGLVQIYSATRPVVSQHCTHLPLKALSRIAQIVRIETGLPVEVF
jgi:wyosine [tRNA(Phe)-imidazoG37] synthetase (radical SAM superfamily)